VKTASDDTSDMMISKRQLLVDGDAAETRNSAEKIDS